MDTREDLQPSRRRFAWLQLRWREPLGKPECPYAHRYVLNLGLFAIRLHVWHRSDDKRHFHNHPYWFWTCVLKGSYTDVSKVALGEYRFLDGEILHPVEIKRDVLKTGSIRFRPAAHSHYVEVGPRGAVTLLLTGPARHNWGFWVGGKLKRPFKYFHQFGHPPCDEL